MVDRRRLALELKRIKKLMRENPEILARFDQDGNGIIDGREWDAVRKLVIQRLERKEAEKAEAERLKAHAEKAAAESDEDADFGLGLHPPDEPPEDEPQVAQEVFEDDMRRVFGGGNASPGAQPGLSVAHLSDFVVEQRGGAGAMFEGTMRRQYRICDLGGNEVATISEHKSDLARNMRFELGGGHLHTSFTAMEPTSGDRVDIALEFGLVGCELSAVGNNNNVSARVTTVGILDRKYEIRGLHDSTSIYVDQVWYKPFSLQVLDPFDEELGQMKRGWSGLGGWLTGANRTRITIDADEVSPSARWGLIATALYFDVQGSRRD